MPRLLAPSVLLAPVLAALAACGSAASGDDPSGGEGAGGSSSAGGAGGSSPGGVTLPDPGPPPASAAGLFGFQRLAGPTSKGGVAWNGWFQMPAKAFNTPDVVSMLKGYPEIPIDTCSGPLPKFSISDGSQPNTLDAGTLSIVDPTGATHAIKKTGIATFVIYQGSLPDSAFVPGGKYGFSAPGAGVTGNFYAPGDLTLTAPSPSKPLVPDGKDLTVAWTSVPDGHPVLIRIHQKSTDVVCRVTDDGEFTIPGSAWKSFQSTTSDPGSMDEDTFSVTHSAWSVMGAGATNAIVFADVGAKLPLQIP